MISEQHDKDTLPQEYKGTGGYHLGEKVKVEEAQGVLENSDDSHHYQCSRHYYGNGQ